MTTSMYKCLTGVMSHLNHGLQKPNIHLQCWLQKINQEIFNVYALLVSHIENVLYALRFLNARITWKRSLVQKGLHSFNNHFPLLLSTVLLQKKILRASKAVQSCPSNCYEWTVVYTMVATLLCLNLYNCDLLFCFYVFCLKQPSCNSWFSLWWNTTNNIRKSSGLMTVCTY